jgi:hypothetical protein
MDTRDVTCDEGEDGKKEGPEMKNYVFSNDI